MKKDQLEWNKKTPPRQKEAFYQKLSTFLLLSNREAKPFPAMPSIP
jgi:hypothetical protein